MLSLVPEEHSFGSRIRRLAAALFGLRPSEQAELVGIANAMTALVLLSRHTYWVPMVLGGLTLAATPALLLAGGGWAYASTAGAWVGGALGLAAGLSVAFFCYRGLMKEMQRRRRDEG